MLTQMTLSDKITSHLNKYGKQENVNIKRSM